MFLLLKNIQEWLFFDKKVILALHLAFPFKFQI